MAKYYLNFSNNFDNARHSDSEIFFNSDFSAPKQKKPTQRHPQSHLLSINPLTSTSRPGQSKSWTLLRLPQHPADKHLQLKTQNPPQPPQNRLLPPTPNTPIQKTTQQKAFSQPGKGVRPVYSHLKASDPQHKGVLQPPLHRKAKQGKTERAHQSLKLLESA
jgi:hypothetical protein